VRAGLSRVEQPTGYMGQTDLAREARGEMGSQHRRRAATLLTILILAGCSARSDVNPVQWWHGLQGGVIAEQRPPPPNADAPYPNLGSVPAKPAMPDSIVRQRVASGLITDRGNAQYQAMLFPLQTSPRASSQPGLSGAPTASPDPNAASASLEAASAPPAGQSATSRQAAPLPPPAPDVSAPPPSVPAAPPPAPHIEGFAIPLGKPAPPPQAPAAPPRVELLGPAAATPLAIGFPPNSAVLAPPDEAALKNLASMRGAHSVEVVGFGDATDATPQVQAEAVDLALARARAIVAALNAAGVPPTAIRMSAQATGRGGAAKLIQ
jgi:outer membrane protein OmpA-like peptidoglycan-associated protein